MDKVLRPERLELDISTSADGTNGNTYVHWKKTMDNFLNSLGNSANTPEAKYNVLVNYVSPDIYLHISAETQYAPAVAVLASLFVKAKNQNYARHCLASRVQKDGESIEQFVIALETLAKDCNFEEATAAQHQEQCIRTACIHIGFTFRPNTAAPPRRDEIP